MAEGSISKMVQSRKMDMGKNYNENFTDITDADFKAQRVVKAEFDMWIWIYQEIAGLRLEVSRLATYVRLNNSVSPLYIEAYHAHIYSLLIPVSTLISEPTWKRIEEKWLVARNDINTYLNQRRVSPRLKIPFELIRKLDELYRYGLCIAQRLGLGIRVATEQNIDAAVSRMIAGSG